MDIFTRQLQELTKADHVDNKGQAVTDHCKHVAVKLLRKFKNGTRGTLELRYLLEDLLNSLPNATTSSTSTAIIDPYADIRAFAKLITSSSNDLDVPLKAKPKRPASIDAANLINDSKRSKLDGLDGPAAIQQEVTNVQLLYDLFSDINQYSSSGQKLSISQLLSQGLASDSQASSLKDTVSFSSHGNNFDIQQVRQSIESLLPPLPRGQALRDRIDTLFRQVQQDDIRKISDPESIRTVLDFLEGLVDILAKLCAPIRDDQVKAIRNPVATCREYLSLEAEPTKLDKAVDSTKAQVLDFIDGMKRDLHLFKMGITVATTDEEELKKSIRKESMERERNIITVLYGESLLKTKIWVESFKRPDVTIPAISRSAIAYSLVEALFQPQPVTVQFGTSTPPTCVRHDGGDTVPLNILPPIFHFAAKHLFVFQNRIQALTILATLSTLVPPSYNKPITNGLSSPSTSTNYTTPIWSERVWTLLNSEIQDDTGKTTSLENKASSSHIKLDNLADEIVIIFRNGKSGTKDEDVIVDEEKIRSSVDRMLRLEDRVFALLHSRLKSAIIKAVDDGSSSNTGEGEVKGFTVHPLPREIANTIKQLKGIIAWACECWDIK